MFEMKHDLSYPTWANRRYRVEAFDLWHYYSWHRYESCIRMQIDFDGHLDEAILAEAFEQSCVTFPLIACLFDTTPLIRPRWAPRREAAREVLRVVEAQGNREEEIRRAFAEVPSIKEGPQLRATLVRSSGPGSRRDSLCLTINHMVCDTVGFKQYVSAVARLYSRIVAGLDPSPAPFVAQRGIGPVVRELTWKERLQAPFTPIKPGPKELRKLPKPVALTFESGPFGLLTMSLPAENFKHLRATAKTLGFTVNTLFMSALALAWRRARGVDEFLLPCTMNQRSFVSSGAHRGITNLSGDCLCIIRISPDDMMENVMAKYTKERAPYQQRLAGVSQLVRWEIMSRFAYFRLASRMLWRMFVSYPLSTTNLGIIDEDCVRFGTVSVRSAHIIAAAPPSPAFTVAMSTFRDEMTVSASVEGDEGAKDFIRAVFAMMREELLAFGSRYPTADGWQRGDAADNATDDVEVSDAVDNAALSDAEVNHGV
jgi:NRPS condensation-like uncharacterized protein